MKMAYARDRAVECQESAGDQWREQVMTGTIKKIMRQKGFGFITPDDGSEDVFFHRGSLAPRNQIEDLNEGDSVQFQVRKGEKGPVALDLKIR
jgi:CspA family cold shock protein